MEPTASGGPPVDAFRAEREMAERVSAVRYGAASGAIETAGKVAQEGTELTASTVAEQIEDRITVDVSEDAVASALKSGPTEMVPVTPSAYELTLKPKSLNVPLPPTRPSRVGLILTIDVVDFGPGTLIHPIDRTGWIASRHQIF